MKFVRAFMYFFQFRLKIYNRFDKFNLIFDVFNQLLSNVDKQNVVGNLNIKSFYFEQINLEIKHFYVFNQLLIIMSDDFR